MSVAASLMRRLSAARRSRSLQLAFSMTLLTSSALFLADFVGAGTDELADRFESRRMVSEALAVQLATLASLEADVAIEHAIGEFVDRNEQVLAARLSDERGTPLAERGDGARIDALSTVSTLDQAIVPVFEGRRPRGELRIAFVPGATHWHKARHFAVVLGMAFLGYLLFLRRALVQLDPGKVVPERVSTAFDMFNEGVIVLDGSLRLLLANKAALAMMGDGRSSPVGRLIDDWPWRTEDERAMPWHTCLRDGRDVAGESLRLGAERPRRFMVSCGAIGGGEDEMRGVLVTFDDITELEARNIELSSTLSLINKKNEELETLATRDPLTGLLNRRALMETFDAAIAAAREADRPLACIMLDIDHFKSINDTYGHGIGDEAICAVAMTLGRECRERDRIGRYGGEEYVVVMPDTDGAEALAVAEKVRETVGALADAAAFPIDRMTISLGVGELGDAEDTATALIDRADKALYVAKEGGRNRSVLHGPDMAEPAADEPAPAAPSSDPRIDELKALLGQREHDLERLRHFDALTGSPRRSMLVDALERETLRARQLGKGIAVVALEIADLSRLGALYGSDLADELELGFTERLRDGLQRSDLVAEICPGHALARVGSNEYVVLITDLDGPERAVAALTRLRRLLSAPFELAEQTLYLGARAGVSLFPDNAETAEPLLDAALLARLAAMNDGDKFSFAFASDGLHETSREYIELEAELYEAVNEGDLTVHYQPKYGIATRKVTGLEALVRWTRADGRTVSPAEFIPVAEASGLIHDVFDLVLDVVLDDLGGWHREGHTGLRVSVNVSGVQLREPNLVMDILGKIRAAGASTSQLEVELTETAMIDSPSRTRIALGQLRDAGVSVSMDDFGTGYTSLALLADLPLDTVKLDRSFIVSMGDNPRNASIVRSVIGMAHALSLKVVAEGVETDEQLERLSGFGCDEIQGYLIGKPVPAADIAAVLGDRRTDRQALGRAA